MQKACKIKELEGKKYHCFFELTLQVIGGKWKPVILYHLAMDPVQRFSDLRRGMPEITERMLTRQLRELEGGQGGASGKSIAKCLRGWSIR